MRFWFGLRRTLLTGHEPQWLRLHPRRRYVRAVALSTPDWVDRAHVKRIYAWRDLLTLATGVEHVVDHDIPLNHPHVCGLTVPANLKVMTRPQNAAKCGKWNPWQLELFP